MIIPALPTFLPILSDLGASPSNFDATNRPSTNFSQPATGLDSRPIDNASPMSPSFVPQPSPSAGAANRNQIYVQTFRNESGGQFSMLPLIQNPTELTHLYLASLHVNSDPGDITLNDNNPNDTLWDRVWEQTAQLQQHGVKVLMSLGGAAQGSFQRLCSGTADDIINDSYYQPLYSTLKEHRLDGVNLDIEEAVQYTCPLALLKRFNQDFGPNFIQTMAPVASELQPSGYGLGGFSYKTLDSEATEPSRPSGNLIDWYNVQFYNGWGDASTPDGYQTIVNNGYDPSRVALGVLDSPADGGSGWYHLTEYQSTISSLRTSYGPSFGGVVGWEYWDAGSGDDLASPYKWVQPVGASVFGTAQKRGEQQRRNASSPFGPAPWPGSMQKLTGMGVNHMAAVKALNMSNGDVTRALQTLGFPALP